MNSSQTSSPKPNLHESLRKLRNIAIQSPVQIRNVYGAKPITLLRVLDPTMRFPKKLRVAFALLWLEQDHNGKPANRFIMKGPRGGGKSKLLGAIGFAKWLLQSRDIVDMGGSLEQATGVYNYFASHCYAHENIVAGLPNEPTMHRTLSDVGNYFKAVAASQKQVRGPHPDNLFIDEACETRDELILAAMPMVNTSKHPLIVMTSTFHKIFGYFQETWDRADELGYVRISWDMLDVTAPFDASIWQDAELRRLIPDLSIEQAGENSLEYRASGRTGDPEGWVPIQNVIQAWREKQTIDWFDVEYMGSRPNASGMVNDPEDVDACIVDNLGDASYVVGAEVIGGLDWGFSSMTSWVALMHYKDNVKSQVSGRNYTEVELDTIIDEVVEDVVAFRIRTIYADSAGKFENVALQKAINKKLREINADWRCTVVEVVFSKDKTKILGNYRVYFQRRLLRIPRKYVDAIYQHKRYRYITGTDKVVKKDDHVPDATQMALKHWPLSKGRTPFPENTPPKKTVDDPERETRFGQIETDVKKGGIATGGLLDRQF